MKKINIRVLLLAVMLSAFSFDACKNKAKDSNATTTDTAVTTTTTAPVIAGDDELKKGVADATKDYPTVTADVTDSVINVSGEIKRADWQRLMPTLNSLHPKRVNSTSLTIK
jgi:hypothetical protein